MGISLVSLTYFDTSEEVIVTIVLHIRRFIYRTISCVMSLPAVLINAYLEEHLAVVVRLELMGLHAELAVLMILVVHIFNDAALGFELKL